MKIIGIKYKSLTYNYVGDLCMNIGYVKIRKKVIKQNRSWLYAFRKNTILSCKKILNIVEQDKYNKNIFYLNNLKTESKLKLINKLIEEKIDVAIVEDNNKINFPTLDGRFTIKAMLPEIVDYCYKIVKPELDEVYVCTEFFSLENISIIEDLTKRVKVVNVVTSHRRYRNLEKRLEENDIFITVSGNKRLSLKKAKIVVNLDFQDFNNYNINRDMVVIDITGKLKLPKSFDGVVVRKVIVDTKKVIRVFSELENFNKQDLIEAELAKINNYIKEREYISIGKIYLDSLYNEREISLQDFLRLKNKGNKLQKQ